MKLYIADKYKVQSYLLPSKVEDSYLIQYVSITGIEENITLTAEDGKWTIIGNYDMSIQKDVSKVYKDVIVNNNIYQITFSDLNYSIYLYCFDTPVNYKSYAIGNKTEIKFGKIAGDIVYQNSNINDNHFHIIRSNNCWLFEDDGTDFSVTYINGVRAHKQYLKLGDVIFTNGVKIVWMDLYFKINNLNQQVNVQLEEYKQFEMLGSENQYTPVKETEKQITLYKDDQVFFHTPRLKETSEEHIIKIVPPPPKIEDDGPPAILTLGATVMMGLSSSITGIIAIFNLATRRTTLLNSITEISVCLFMIIGTVCFPILLDKYQKRKMKKKEKKRQEKYTEYLEEKKKNIQEIITKETSLLLQNNLNSQELQQNVIQRTNKIWSREIQDNDFLTFRLGLGNKKANIKIDTTLEEFSMEEDNLKKQVEEIVNSPFVLEKVPITASLIENKVLPFIINYDYPGRKLYIDNIMIQLISYYSGVDLKIVILTSQNQASDWEYVKYLPHCISKDCSVRFFATNEEEMKQVSSYLEKIYQERVDDVKGNNDNDENIDDIDTENNKNAYINYSEYYLIITDNYLLAKKSGIVNKIVNSTANLGFSLFMIEPTMQNLPSKINQFIEISNNRCSIFNKNLSEENEHKFFPEYFNNNILYFAQIISNIPISSINNGSSLPTSINFLEMYKVGKIEQLNILNKWEHNDPTISLHTPIGVHEDGKLFELDLHEKYHGPHGLIAGATGSGKSEFIITFILSMAINYHPYEVQFVLIDYKGGGLAGAFENKETGVKIPHLVGTITNLDTAEMNRTLVSINSELKRRQRMFNEARDKLNESTVDIYKYQKFYREGKVSEPISHLFIISDEFAELKSQQPDFMEELISTARIGRSLGVHLILATQKPSGVVDDQIWSNSRFKIALKVQTAEDSNELLKRADAAYIKETGRFYLQVGYNELFEIGQSAWSGARYIPTDRIFKSLDDSIDFVDNNGNILQKVNDTVKVSEQSDLGDQLTNIVGTLFHIAEREKIEFKQLWLPSIPTEIYLSNIINKYKYQAKPYCIDPVIGEYDNPKQQKQGLLTIDFTNTGNLIIYGNPGSGKENLVTTLVYSVCIYHRPEEVNFYLLDFGAETFKNLATFPHVGDVALVEDKDKVSSCFLMLERELNRRKELFSDYGGTYTSYISQSKEKLPLIITIMNGYESFVENYGNYDDYFAHLLRESSKYGIVIILTAMAAGAVRTRISQCFNNIIMMQVSDDFDYKFVMNAPDGLKPSRNFGRGLVTVADDVFEFQTSYIYLKDKINDIMKDTAQKLSSTYSKVSPIPIIPKTVTYDTMSAYIDSIMNVPIGINIKNAKIERFNFIKNHISQVIGNNVTIDNSFSINLIRLMSAIPNIKLKVFDFVDSITDSTNFDYSNGNFTKAINLIRKTDKETKNKIIYILIGIGYIYDKVLDEGINALYEIFNNVDKYQNSYFVLIDNLSSYKRIMTETWYRNIKNTNGIWIGKNFEVQTAIKVDHILKSDANEEFNGLGYVVEDGKYRVIKLIGTVEGNDEYE